MIHFISSALHWICFIILLLFFYNCCGGYRVECVCFLYGGWKYWNIEFSFRVKTCSFCCTYWHKCYFMEQVIFLCMYITSFFLKKKCYRLVVSTLAGWLAIWSHQEGMRGSFTSEVLYAISDLLRFYFL